MKRYIIPIARIICLTLFVISVVYAVANIIRSFRTVYIIVIEKQHVFTDINLFGMELSDWSFAFISLLVSVTSFFFALFLYIVIKFINKKQVSGHAASTNPSSPDTRA